MRKKFQKVNPSNARIYINYKDKKNPVRFEYPCKQTAFRIAFPFFRTVFLLVNVIPFIFLAIIFGFIYPFVVENTTGIIENPSGIISIIQLFSIIVGMFSYFIGIPYLYAKWFVLSEKRVKMLAEMQPRVLNLLSRNESLYVKVKNIDKKIFEIPLFNNIRLDYKLTQDFREYIHKVEIIEHNLKYKVIKGWFKKKITKMKKQDDYWFCRFYFTRIPRLGYLEVEFV